MVSFYYYCFIEIPVVNANNVDLIRCHILRHLLWVCTVANYPLGVSKLKWVFFQGGNTYTAGTLEDYDIDRITEKDRVDHLLHDVDAEFSKLEGITS